MQNVEPQRETLWFKRRVRPTAYLTKRLKTWNCVQLTAVQLCTRIIDSRTLMNSLFLFTDVNMSNKKMNMYVDEVH